MGYRSDVALCLNRAGKDQLDKTLGKADCKIAETVRNFLAEASEHHEDPRTGCVIWYWGDIKWYYDYEEIGFIERLMDSMDQDKYLFYRLGEESDDTEIRGCFHCNPFDLYLQRGISFEAP